MLQTKKKSTKKYQLLVSKKELKLSSEEIKKTPKLSDLGYIWAG